jgi:hypothetical protein
MNSELLEPIQIIQKILLAYENEFASNAKFILDLAREFSRVYDVIASQQKQIKILVDLIDDHAFE